LGVVIPVSAQSTTTTTSTAAAAAQTLKTVQGIVTAVSPSSTTQTFTIGTNPAITVDANTKYYLIPVGAAQSYVDNKVAQDQNDQSTAAKLKNLHIPANWRDSLGFLDTFSRTGTFSDIAVGDRVIARVNSSNVATQVLIIKAPVIRQVRGYVDTSTPISSTGMTVDALDKTQVSLKFSSDTEFIIKGYALPTSGYVVVTYNYSTKVASLVNFTAKDPATDAAATTTTTTTTTTTSTTITP
jgi:hypothetical protein